MKINLAEIAMCRSGDKGNIADLALFAPNREVYEFFKTEITSIKVKDHFTGICTGEVERYEVPNVFALKFVLHDALGGGAPSSLRMDNLGKSLSAALLRMNVEIPSNLQVYVKEKKPAF